MTGTAPSGPLAVMLDELRTWGPDLDPSFVGVFVKVYAARLDLDQLDALIEDVQVELGPNVIVLSLRRRRAR